MTDFHCAAIHNNIRVEGSASRGVRILPCCLYKTDNNYATLSHYQNSEEIQILKKTTTWPAGCHICKSQEELGQLSVRNHNNVIWPDPTKSYGTRFEIFPSNICNLKCLMCSPISSSALAQERNKMQNIKLSVKEFDITEECLDIVQVIDDIESISLIGGEFFLARGNLKILDFAIEKNIPVRVVTNATVILPDHIKKLKQVSKLELQISIDGIDDSYEFMRYPAKWSTFEENIALITKELHPDRINFHYVVQVLNIQNLVPTLDYLNRYRIKTSITNLTHPTWLSWAILDIEEKQKIIDLLQQHQDHYAITNNQKHFVKNLCQTILDSSYDAKSREEFVDTVGKTIKIRKLTDDVVRQQLGIFKNLFDW